ncbi:MAG: hypothetical protein J2P47_10535 [Acetobacteraceae bacterium]|nr:hypothetical protein [Acetobacteraceae bacterium]
MDAAIWGLNGVGEAARALALDFATRADAHDRDRSFPFENFAKVAVIGAIAGGDASTALVLLMH